MVPPSAKNGNRWLSSLPLLSCTCVERMRSFMIAERRRHAFVHIGVPDIEAEVQIQVRLLEKVEQALGARKLVGNVFEQHFHAALAREQVDFFERRERGIHLALVVFLFGHAQVLDQVAERNDLGDIQARA